MVKKVKYKSNVRIKLYTPREHLVGCVVKGKIKGIPAYIVDITHHDSVMLINRFGYAIKHLELDWGNFGDAPANEFIISEEDIVEVLS